MDKRSTSTAKLHHLSLALYAISLVLPPFRGTDGLLGIQALQLGWIGVLPITYIGLAWLANPLYFLTLILYKVKTKFRVSLATLTLIFSLFTFLIEEIPVDEGGRSDFVSVGIGFFVWFLSFVVLFIHTYLQLKPKLKNK